MGCTASKPSHAEVERSQPTSSRCVRERRLQRFRRVGSLRGVRIYFCKCPLQVSNISDGSASIVVTCSVLWFVSHCQGKQGWTDRSLSEGECSLSFLTRCRACCSLSRALNSIKSVAQCLKNSTGALFFSSCSLTRCSNLSDTYSRARGCRYSVFVPGRHATNDQDVGHQNQESVANGKSTYSDDPGAGICINSLAPDRQRWLLAYTT